MWIIALDLFTGYVIIYYKSTCLHRLGIANFIFRPSGSRLLRPSLPAPLPLSLICSFINNIFYKSVVLICSTSRLRFFPRLLLLLPVRNYGHASLVLGDSTNPEPRLL